MQFESLFAARPLILWENGHRGRVAALAGNMVVITSSLRSLLKQRLRDEHLLMAVAKMPETCSHHISAVLANCALNALFLYVGNWRG